MFTFFLISEKSYQRHFFPAKDMRFYWIPQIMLTKPKAEELCEMKNAKLLRITTDIEFKIAKFLVMEKLRQENLESELAEFN